MTAFLDTALDPATLERGGIEAMNSLVQLRYVEAQRIDM